MIAAKRPAADRLRTILEGYPIACRVPFRPAKRGCQGCWAWHATNLSVLAPDLVDTPPGAMAEWRDCDHSATCESAKCVGPDTRPHRPLPGSWLTSLASTISNPVNE